MSATNKRDAARDCPCPVPMKGTCPDCPYRDGTEPAAARAHEIGPCWCGKTHSLEDVRDRHHQLDAPAAAPEPRGWVKRLGSYLRIFGKHNAYLVGPDGRIVPNEALIHKAQQREAEFGGRRSRS